MCPLKQVHYLSTYTKQITYPFQCLVHLDVGQVGSQQGVFFYPMRKSTFKLIISHVNIENGRLGLEYSLLAECALISSNANNT